MSFIAVVMALLIEQARPMAPGTRLHALMRAWAGWSTRNFDAGQAAHAWLAWSLAVGVPSVLVLAVYWSLDAWLGWPAALVWSVAVLYATLGFRQFSSHFTQIREALANSDETLARDLLANWRQMDVRDLPRSEVLRSVMAHSVIAAHRHVFGVLAFFSLLAVFGLGPAGAVLYRASEFLARFWRDESQTRFQPVSQQTQDAAGLAWDLLDWVPARITAVSFAVVGSFEDAMEAWRRHLSEPDQGNDALILAATAGAVNIRLSSAGPVGAQPDAAKDSSLAGLSTEDQAAASGAGQTPELAHLAVIVGLVWRTVVMWVVLLALLTLARLLG